MLQLHDYQLVARDFLRGRDRAALFLDMGLGKTASAATALEPRHLPVLVVAPKRVADTVWEAEIALWRPDLTITVARGGPQERAALLADPAPDIIVLGRDTLATDLKHIINARRRTRPFKTVILDELSGFKSKTSTRWKAANTVIKQKTTEYVWGLTGTPSPNGYLDLWPQMALIDPNLTLAPNLTTYRSRFFSPGRMLPSGVIIEWLLRPDADNQIKEIIQPFCLAMTGEGRIKLPPVTFNNIAVELPPAVRKEYRELKDQLVIDLTEIFGGEIHTAGSFGALTARLSQITSGFIYVDNADLRNSQYTLLHKEKINALREIQEASQGNNLLVFYRFRAELEMIREAFPEAWGIDEPDAIKKWNRGEIPMLVAHPASAGHGLNLQHGGHIVVWTSPTWDLEHWDQANKRLARQGQKHPVVIHTILANKTIDHQVAARLQQKSDSQQDLLAFLESPV